MRTLILISGTLLFASNPFLPAFAAPAAAPAAADPFTISGVLSVPRPKYGRVRPLIVVVADKEGVQTTDFIVPYGVLKDSGVADVRSVSTGTGPIRMTCGLKIVSPAAPFSAGSGLLPLG